MKLCSGLGAYHTNNPKAKNSRPRPLIAVTLDDILAMVKNPPSVAKSKAQWLIPSTLLSRIHAEQRQKGKFYSLWFDADNLARWSFDEFVRQSFQSLGVLNCQFIAYTSKSATSENPKSRLIIPLSEPVNGETWVMLQKILNDKLEAIGIEPDRATERPGQLCYLPNRGEFYRYHIKNCMGMLSPSTWESDIQAEKERIEAEEKAKKQRQEQARQKAIRRMKSGCKSPIDAFNQSYDLEMLMESYGYVKKSRKWLSPNSESKVPGVKITDDGKKWLSAHDSDSGIGAPTKTGTMGDGFDLYVHYRHSGNRDTAIREISDMFQLNNIKQKIPDASFYEDCIRETDLDHDRPNLSFLNESQPSPPEPNKKVEVFSLDSFSLAGEAKSMEKQMLEDKFIFDQLAILGQSTVFYSKSGIGKTLMTIRFLVQAIEQDGFNGEKIYYINADDNYRGLVYKLKIADEFGFHMLAPGHKNFESEKLPIYLEKLIKAGTVPETVLILDTVKKFADLMSKEKSSGFSKKIREFISHGGTVIMLAHVNKHPGEDGKPVYSGTTDLVDDSDCAYTIDILIEDSTTRTIVFENIKSRGNNVRKVSYKYNHQRFISYGERLFSIEKIDEDERKELVLKKYFNDQLKANQPVINIITETIKSGITSKTELVNAVWGKLNGVSKTKIRGVLDSYTGDFWQAETGANNKKVYKLLK